jgi:hypothetical protein
LKTTSLEIGGELAVGIADADDRRVLRVDGWLDAAGELRL